MLDVFQDKPARFFIETAGASLDLLVGNQIDGNRYAKLAAAPGVFTVSGLEPIINIKPFTLVDKFAFLIDIDSVARLSISGGERPLSADFQGEGDEAVYFLDGKKAETRSFKDFYQTVIGLLADAEYPQTPGQNSAQSPAEIGELNEGYRIEYRLNTPPGERMSITLTPYNRDFYALNQDGATEFLISRSQVRNIFDAAEKVVFE